MKKIISFSLIIVSCILFSSCNPGLDGNYKGKPYSDKIYSGGPQVIPGKLQCEYYDSGGEGVAFHDTDSINSGSGRLNPADGSYLHEFRINEAADISFTKFQELPIDNNAYNFVEPQKDQLYIGWTMPGEWTEIYGECRKIRNIQAWYHVHFQSEW